MNPTDEFKVRDARESRRQEARRGRIEQRVRDAREVAASLGRDTDQAEQRARARFERGERG